MDWVIIILQLLGAVGGAVLLWRRVRPQMVYVSGTPTSAKKFHAIGCRHLVDGVRTSRVRAKKLGYIACRDCRGRRPTERSME